MTSPQPPPDGPRTPGDLLSFLITGARRQIEQVRQDDEQAKQEARAIKAAGASAQQTQATMAQLHQQSFAQDIKLRKVFAYSILAVVVCWMAGVLLLVGGTRVTVLGLSAEVHLADNVAMTLLGTTSLNVIGLLFVVARYLFPQGSDQQPKS